MKFKTPERRVPYILQLTFPVNHNTALFSVEFVLPGTHVLIHYLHSPVQFTLIVRLQVVRSADYYTGVLWVHPILAQRPKSFNCKIRELIKKYSSPMT